MWHRKDRPTAGALVEARDLQVNYDGVRALDSVDLRLDPGEIVTIIGPNGAGKTTLVRVVLGLTRPDNGRVARRKGLRFGYVPQRFHVDPTLPMTVARFLALPARHPRPELAKALADVGVPHVIDKPLQTLSGGEFQRVMLARTLLRRPDLLVLDEPLQGVDLSGQIALFDLIGKLRDKHGFGVLMVSHDLHVVMRATDRVLCLNHHVCCSGEPEAVSQHPEYLDLFGPEAARALAVYAHHHDHAHSVAGDVVSLAQDPATGIDEGAYADTKGGEMAAEDEEENAGEHGTPRPREATGT
jgi:zinc transport system ATP-binding protein